MENPWFNLDPNNLKDKWWLYTSITDTKAASIDKFETDIICYLIIQEHNLETVFYRISVWFKDDANRYIAIKNKLDFDKKLSDMKEGDIVNIYSSSFKVYDCKFPLPKKFDFLKIFVKIDK